MQLDDTLRKTVTVPLKGKTFTLKTLTIEHYSRLVKFVREQHRELFHGHVRDLSHSVQAVDEETARLLMEALVERFLSPVSLFSQPYFRMMGTPEGLVEWFFQSAIESHPELTRDEIASMLDNETIREVREHLHDLLRSETTKAEEIKKDSPDTLTPKSAVK